MADAGHEPVDSPVEHDYLRQPEGPRPGDGGLLKYVNAAQLLPQPTGFGSGSPRLPYYHQLSPQVTMGDDLYRPFDPRLGGQ